MPHSFVGHGFQPASTVQTLPSFHNATISPLLLYLTEQPPHSAHSLVIAALVLHFVSIFLALSGILYGNLVLLKVTGTPSALSGTSFATFHFSSQILGFSFRGNAQYSDGSTLPVSSTTKRCCSTIMKAPMRAEASTVAGEVKPTYIVASGIGDEEGGVGEWGRAGCGVGCGSGGVRRGGGNKRVAYMPSRPGGCAHQMSNADAKKQKKSQKNIFANGKSPISRRLPTRVEEAGCRFVWSSP